MAWGKVTSVQSSPHLNRVNPASVGTGPVQDVGLTWALNTEFPWYVASGNNVLITSSASVPTP